MANKKKQVKIKIYTCGVDWQHEIGHASDVVMYATVADLKRKRTCWKSCGIVELEVTLNKWVYPQDLLKDIEKLVDKRKKN